MDSNLSKESESGVNAGMASLSDRISSHQNKAEVKKRLEMLEDLAEHPQSKEAKDGIQAQLGEMLCVTENEGDLIKGIQSLTEIPGVGESHMEAIRFLPPKRDPEKLSEKQYRNRLFSKLLNTIAQAINLSALFPKSVATLKRLGRKLQALRKKIMSGKITKVKAEEEAIRASSDFHFYETLKENALRKWLEKFTKFTNEEISQMSPEEINSQVTKHGRHLMTELLKTKIEISDKDIGGRMGVHDTLCGDFSNEAFWGGARAKAKKGFQEWILSVIQTFGMVRGKRFVLFRSKINPKNYMLFGVGFTGMPGEDGLDAEPVPYIKPFVEEDGKLLEVRLWRMEKKDEYFSELRHYTLPFLFAIDQLPNMDVEKETISFFNSGY